MGAASSLDDPSKEVRNTCHKCLYQNNMRRGMRSARIEQGPVARIDFDSRNQGWIHDGS